MPKYKTGLQRCGGKLSVAVKSLIAGLKAQSKRPDFKINMMSFGHSEGEICFGCAATCVMQFLAHIDYTPEILNTDTDTERAEYLRWPKQDFEAFEVVMDHLRVFKVR